MKHFITCIVIVLLVAVAGVLYVSVKKASVSKTPDGIEVPVETPVTGNEKIVIDNLRPGQTISSPLTVTGRARGVWFFEASFPVKLVDSNGQALAIMPAQAMAEWMTEDFVPFSVTLNFTSPAVGEGFLIFQKDNPSGLPEFDEAFEIPIKFH